MNIKDIDPLKATFRMDKENPVVRSRRWYDRILEWIWPEKYEMQKLNCLVALAQSLFADSSKQAQASEFIFAGVATLKDASHFFIRIPSHTIDMLDVKSSSDFQTATRGKSVKRELLSRKSFFYLKNSKFLASLCQIGEALRNPNMKIKEHNKLLDFSTIVTQFSDEEQKWCKESVGFLMPLFEMYINNGEKELSSTLQNSITEPSSSDFREQEIVFPIFRAMSNLYQKETIRYEALLSKVSEMEESIEFFKNVKTFLDIAQNNNSKPETIFAAMNPIEVQFPHMLQKFPVALSKLQHTLEEQHKNKKITSHYLYSIHENFFIKNEKILEGIKERELFSKEIKDVQRKIKKGEFVPFKEIYEFIKRYEKISSNCLLHEKERIEGQILALLTLFEKGVQIDIRDEKHIEEEYQIFNGLFNNIPMQYQYSMKLLHVVTLHKSKPLNGAEGS